MKQFHAIASTLEDTERVAQMLLQAKGTGIVALTGNLGSGKTTFSQCLARCMGSNDTIASPTFTLINEYEIGEKRLVHSDFYRLQLKEIALLGLTDHFTDPTTLTVVEWADRYPTLFPRETVWLHFTLCNPHRVITLRSNDDTFWHQFEPLLAITK